MVPPMRDDLRADLVGHLPRVHGSGGTTSRLDRGPRRRRGHPHPRSRSPHGADAAHVGGALRRAGRARNGAGATRRSCSPIWSGRRNWRIATTPSSCAGSCARTSSACTPVFATLGGHAHRFLGDGILASFGYPTAHEDDARRAVQAALDIVARRGRRRPATQGRGCRPEGQGRGGVGSRRALQPGRRRVDPDGRHLRYGGQPRGSPARSGGAGRGVHQLPDTAERRSRFRVLGGRAAAARQGVRRPSPIRGVRCIGRWHADEWLGADRRGEAGSPFIGHEVELGTAGASVRRGSVAAAGRC